MVLPCIMLPPLLEGCLLYLHSSTLGITKLLVHRAHFLLHHHHLVACPAPQLGYQPATWVQLAYLTHCLGTACLPPPPPPPPRLRECLLAMGTYLHPLGQAHVLNTSISKLYDTVKWTAHIIFCCIEYYFQINDLSPQANLSSTTSLSGHSQRTYPNLKA